MEKIKKEEETKKEEECPHLHNSVEFVIEKLYEMKLLTPFFCFRVLWAKDIDCTFALMRNIITLLHSIHNFQAPHLLHIAFEKIGYSEVEKAVQNNEATLNFIQKLTEILSDELINLLAKQFPNC